MDTLSINFGHYYINGYYPKVPSTIDGTFTTDDGQKLHLFMRDTSESRNLNSIVWHYSEEQMKKANRNGQELRPFYIARCWTYICFLLGTTDLRGKSWCDMSAGWGVHLISAMMSGMKYYSCDPNSSMHSAYRRIIQDFQGDATVLEAGFETPEVAPEPESYDIFFSSPPYFDWEVYSDDEGQSIKKFPNYIDWLVNFLFPCFSKGAKAVKTGGYVILYMQDLLHIRYCEASLFYFREYHPELEYRGIISCGGESKLYPTFIWKKTSPYIKGNFSGRLLTEHYNTISQGLLTMERSGKYRHEVPIININVGTMKWKRGKEKMVSILLTDRTKERGMKCYFEDDEVSEKVEYSVMNYDFWEEVAVANLCSEYRLTICLQKGRTGFDAIRDLCHRNKVKYEEVNGPKKAIFKRGDSIEEKKRKKNEFLSALYSHNKARRDLGVNVIDYTMQINYLQRMRDSMPLLPINPRSIYLEAKHYDVYKTLREVYPEVIINLIRSEYSDNYKLYPPGTRMISCFDKESSKTCFTRVYQEGDCYWDVSG